MVRRAKYKDVEGMMEVCEKNLLSINQGKMSVREVEKQGFLMSKLEENYAKKLLDDEENYIVLVACDGDEVLGYLTAGDISKVANDFQNEIEELQGHKILYYIQIAKKPGMKGIGTALLMGLFEEAKRSNYTDIICKIVHEPFCNKASIRFHEKYGFKKLRLAQEKSRVVGVYLKML